jgi:hypothetical protein
MGKMRKFVEMVANDECPKLGCDKAMTCCSRCYMEHAAKLLDKPRKSNPLIGELKALARKWRHEREQLKKLLIESANTGEEEALWRCAMQLEEVINKCLLKGK